MEREPAPTTSVGARDADDVRKEDLHVEVLRKPSPWPEPSIVRITHLPTGTVVISDEFKSTLAAKQDALVRLREALRRIDGGES